MGIQDVWPELEPAAQCTTLPKYCLSAFSDNHNDLRSLTIGIDVSLWLFHALKGIGAFNPHLRLLFFKLAKLFRLPVLPLFVFDGPGRPTWKRGKQVQGRRHAIEKDLVDLIEAFGFQWRRAKGEAEAELAHLNAIGAIDAVLTDDSDTLLFGAKTVIRNWGKNLTGTRYLSRTDSKASGVFSDPSSQDEGEPSETAAPSQMSLEHKLSGSDKDHIITIYTSDSIFVHPKLGIDQDGMILVALLAGGDYDPIGIMRCGAKTAVALARSGFGKSLINAFRECYSPTSSLDPNPKFRSFVLEWLEEVRAELRSNTNKFLSRKGPTLASKMTDDFLSTIRSREVLAYYVYPLTSKNDANLLREEVHWNATELDLPRLAHSCQVYFKWSTNTILTRFRSLIWPGVVARRLRQEILRSDSIPVSEDPAGQDLSYAPVERHRPYRGSPHATRITQFFPHPCNGKKPPSNDAQPMSRPIRRESSVLPTVEVRSISKERLHAACEPFLEYRVQVGVQEYVTLALQGIDAQLEAHNKADRDAEMTAENGSAPNENDSDTEAQASEYAPVSPRKRRQESSTAKALPNDPLKVWIAKPLLHLSSSGAGPLASFLDQQQQKKALAAEASKKGGNKSLRTKVVSDMRAQRSLTEFLRPQAKATLTSRSPTKSVTTQSQHQDKTDTARNVDQGLVSRAAEAGGDTTAIDTVPRSHKKMIVPRGMQRATSSFAPTGRSCRTNLSQPHTRSVQKHTSLPVTKTPSVLLGSMVELVDDERDSSVEFVEAVTVTGKANTSNAGTGSNGNMHPRSSKSPRTMSPSQIPTSPGATSSTKSSEHYLASERVLEALFDSASDDDDDMMLSPSSLLRPSAFEPRHKMRNNFIRQSSFPSSAQPKSARKVFATIDLTSSSSEKE